MSARGPCTCTDPFTVASDCPWAGTPSHAVSDLPMCACGQDRVMGLATMKCPACWPAHVYQPPEEWDDQ